MNAAPPLDNVIQALDALYHQNDASGKENASIWLGALQKSVFAWQLSDQLLMLNRDVESCYFAAQTMRTKIQYSFHELPENSYESLKESLLSHLQKVTEATPHAISTQLCLAVADLALQMVAWKHAVRDLIQRFGGVPQHWLCLLELLTVLPEEINSRSLRLGANRRTEVTEELRANATLFIQFLNSVLESASLSSKLQLTLFKCLGSWFTVWAIPHSAVVGTKLLDVPFVVLAKADACSDLHEAASDCVCQILYSASEELALAGELFPRVHSLLQPYHMSVTMEDLDKSIGYCRVFTELAECFLEAIVRTPNQGFGSLTTLDLLLTCVGHHQYELAEITFNVWYRLSEELYQINMPVLNDTLRPYVERLIVALYRHCQFDSDLEGIPSKRNDFVDFRNKVVELIKDVVFIVGSSNVFSKMFEQLQHSHQTQSSWETSEAALFVMMAVARNIVPDDDQVVPSVFTTVLELPPQHIMVQHTSLRLIGELNEWIEQHPMYLEGVLQFLLSGLQNPALATVAAESLVKICEQCRSQMTGHFSGLVQIVQAVDSFSVSHDAASELLRGTALILTKLPGQDITTGLRQLCELQTTQINKILKESSEKEGGQKADPSKYVDRLAALFRDTKPEVTNGEVHPFQPVIQEIWPVISHTCDQYQADVGVIERCCRCIRYLIRSLQKHSHVLLPPLVIQIVRLYSHHQHSCFLYLGSILVDEYGSETECHEGLVQMFEAFCPPAFKQLEEENGIRNHPDTVDDFFRMCYRFTQRAPLLLLKSPMMKPLMLCSIAAVSVNHRDANASVTKFLVDLVKLATDADLPQQEPKVDWGPHLKQQLSDVLKEHGQGLTTALLRACIFHLPVHMVADSSEVLHYILLFNKQLTGEWLETALTGLPTHAAGGVKTATKEQLEAFHQAFISATEIRTITRVVRDFIRLYR